jgi:hypothetical protein
MFRGLELMSMATKLQTMGVGGHVEATNWVWMVVMLGKLMREERKSVKKPCRGNQRVKSSFGYPTCLSRHQVPPDLRGGYEPKSAA